MIRKCLALALAALMAMSVLAGCAASTGKTDEKKDAAPATPAAAPAPQKVELRALWWGSQDRHDRTLKAIEAFQKKYPHITITSEFSGWDVYWDKVQVKVASGDAPDLIQMDFAYLNDYAGRDALLDLGKFVGSELDLAKMDKNLIEAGKANGKLYAIALGGNVFTMHVNKTLLDKVGLPLPKYNWTWADFEDYSKKVREKTKDFWFSPDQTNILVIFEYWLRQRGPAGMWKGAELNFTEKDMLDWFKYWDDLRKAGLIPPGDMTASFAGGLENSHWVKQKGVLQWGWAAEYERYATVIKDEVVMIPFPYAASGKDAHYPKASMYWSASAKTKYPKEVATFINWFINDPEAAKILASSRGVPVTTTAQDTLKQVGLSKYDTAVYEAMDKILKTASPTPAPAPKGQADVQKLMDRLSEEIRFGKKTPEAAAKEFMTEATAILKKANAN